MESLDKINKDRHILISVHDRSGVRVGFLDNEKPKSLHYYGDSWHRYLSQGSETFDFSVYKTGQDVSMLNEENYVSFRFGQRDHFFKIRKIEETETEITCYCESTNIELLNEEAQPYEATKAMSLVEYLNIHEIIGSAYISNLTVGINEVSSKKLKLSWEGYETKLARLLSLVNSFDAECEFETILNSNGTFQQLKMNVYRKHDDEYQGVGTRIAGKTLYYGDGLDSIRRTVDISELVTAIQPKGSKEVETTTDGQTSKETVEVNLRGFSKPDVYDSDGRKQFYLKNGVIYAPQSMDRFPACLAPDSDKWVKLIWETEYSTQESLYGNALSKLKTLSEPSIEYEIEGDFDLEIGDTVIVHDDKFDPALILEVRVSEQEYCFTDPTKCRNVFSNVKALENKLSSFIVGRMMTLIDEALPVTIDVLIDGATIFKNKEGSATLSGRLMKGEKEVSASSWKWYKDGTQVASTCSIKIDASDITGSSVYRIEAVRGGKVYQKNVTMSEVRDGLGISTIKDQYTLSTSTSTNDGTDWSDSTVEYVDGKAVWSRYEITYDDGSIGYTNGVYNAVATNGYQASFRCGELEADNAVIHGSLTAHDAHFTELETDNAVIHGSLSAHDAHFTELETDNATIKGKLTAHEADITTLTADTATVKAELNAATANITLLSADSAYLKEAVAEKLSVDDFNASNATITNLIATKANITDLTAATGRITDLESDNVTVKNTLNAATASIGTLTADTATIKGKLEAAEADITDLTTAHANITGRLEAAEGNITTLTADTATISGKLEAAEGNILTLTTENTTVKGRLNAAEGNIETLTTENTTVKGRLDAAEAVIDDLDATYARITTLNAATGRIDTLETGYATVNTALIGKADIDLANVQAGSITTAMIGDGVVGTAQIADGSITDAKIVGLTASKITAGTLDAGTIDVVNLNADNITVGTINGQLIGAGSVDMEKLSEGVVETIDTLGVDIEQAKADILGVDSKIDSLEVGGRNLILKSDSQKVNAYGGANLTFQSGQTVDDWKASDAYRVTGTKGTSNIFAVLESGRSSSNNPNAKSINGQNYTHSIYVKNLGDPVQIRNNSLSNAVVTVGTNEITRVVLQGVGDGTRNLQFTLNIENGTNIDFIYWHPKIETGNLVTDWTPAPEDVNSAISTAQATADTAMSTADGKNTVYRQATTPSTTGRKTGDVWFDTANDNRIYIWSGSAWTLSELGEDAIANLAITNAKIADATIQSAKIANLDAGKITTGTLDANRIAAGSLSVGKLSDLSVSGRNLVVDGEFSKINTNANLTKGSGIFPASWNYCNTGLSNYQNIFAVYIDQDTFGYNVAVFNESDGTRHWKGLSKSIVDGWGFDGTWDHYRLSIDVYATGTGTKLTGGFYYARPEDNGTRNFRSGQFSIPSSKISVGGWSRVSVEIPYNHDWDGSSVVGFYLYGYDFSANEILYVKNISINNATCTCDFTRNTGEISVENIYTAGTTTIDGAKITTGSIVASKIAANAITADKIAANAITSAKIQAGAITAAALSASAVTADKIAAGAVNADKIAAGSITADKIVADAITTDKVAAHAITANELAVGCITAASGIIASIDASKITTGTLDAERIAAGSLSVGQFGDLRIGGRNLALDSEINKSNISTYNVAVINLSETPEVGEQYTLSMWGCSVEGGTLGLWLNGGGKQIVTNLPIDEDGKVTYTFTVPSDFVAHETTGKRIGIYNYPSTQTGKSASIEKVKFEKGTVPTDWTPAPEDVTNAITDGSIANWCYENNMSYIDGGHIYTGTIEAKSIAAGTITADKLKTGTITSASGVIGSLDAGDIKTGTLSADRIGAKTITVDKLDSKAISVGSRNLILNSATKQIAPYNGGGTYTAATMTTTTGVTVSEWGAKDAFTCSGTASSASNGLLGTLATGRSSSSNPTNLQLDQEYVGSIYIKNNHATNTVKVYFNGYRAASSEQVVINPGECKRITCRHTGNTTSTNNLQMNFYSGGGASSGYKFTYWHPQIEVGYFASDWSPAPEDISVENIYSTGTTTIDGGKITTGTITATAIAANTITAAKIAAGAITTDKIASSAITADKVAAGAITATKISVNNLSAVSANLGTITTGKLQDTSGNITMTLDGTNSELTIQGAKLKIVGSTGTKTGTALADQQIGGKNLLYGTKKFDRDYWNVPSAWTTGNVGANTSLSISGVTGSSYDLITKTGSKNDQTIYAGRQYTLSFWAKGTGTIISMLYGTNGYYFVTKAESSQGKTSTSNNGSIQFDLSSSWTKYSVTWTVGSSVSHTSNGTTTTATFNAYSPVRVLVCRPYTSGTEVQIYAPMFEEGNVASSWCEHLGDYGGDGVNLLDNSSFNRGDTSCWTLPETSTTRGTLSYTRYNANHEYACNNHPNLTIVRSALGTSTSRVFVENKTATTLINQDMKAGDKFTLSGYYYIFGESSQAMGGSVEIFCRQYESGSSGTYTDTGASVTIPTTVTRSAWTYFETVGTVAYTNGGNFLCAVAIANTVGMRISSIKIEKGTKASKWTPSDEDGKYYTLADWCVDNDTTVIDGAKIGTGTIEAKSIAAGTITADKIAANAITADKIAAGAITANKLNTSELVAFNAGIAGSLRTVKGNKGGKVELSNGEIKLYSDTSPSDDTSYLVGTIYAINRTQTLNKELDIKLGTGIRFYLIDGSGDNLISYSPTDATGIVGDGKIYFGKDIVVSGTTETNISNDTTYTAKNGTQYSWLDYNHPVGDIVQSTSANFNPNTLWGGTWVKIEGRFLIGANSTYPVSSTGGNSTLTLRALVGAVNGLTDSIGYKSADPISGQSYTYAVRGTGQSSISTVNHATPVMDATQKTVTTNIMPPYKAVNIWERTA